ncbi:MAG: hypothetical protein ACK5OX_18735, partial [Desertimonas sp.]
MRPAPRPPGRRTSARTAAVTAAMLPAAVGATIDDTTATTDTVAVTLSTDAGRVVVLAEEDVLADVLALGIAVHASSATVPDAGFQGMGDLPTDGIELFDYLTISLEEVAAMDADHVIVWQFAA